MATRRRKDLAARRRRVEDEGDDEGGLEADLDDDSSEGSVLSEEADPRGGKHGGTADSASAASPELSRVNGRAESPSSAGMAKPVNNVTEPSQKLTNGTTDMDMMLNGLKLSDQTEGAKELHYQDLRDDPDLREPSPAVVKSSAAMDQPMEAPHERRRREHEEYRKKRDADPAFVPNRGAFFMHDHRHSGPAANGFRPFGRGRGRGRPGIGGPYAPHSQMQQVYEPTDAPWAHDMHDAISEPVSRNPHFANGTSNYPPRAPVSAPQTAAPNRSLSNVKHIGNVQVRVFLVNMEKPLVFPGVAVKQYTRLPDHRPPLRRDKPVRISLPDNPPRYIFPAIDRSFIFIPRAMRPNQQGFGGRGKGRPGLGSVGGYSRRTSVFGGSAFGGSTYAPSITHSRRSSLAREVLRETVVSPSGSTISRAQMTQDLLRPVVKLPPPSQSVLPPQAPAVQLEAQGPPQGSTLEDVPRPQTYPLPQKPAFRENRPNAIPMHQPRPQKAVSISDIESPATLSFNPPPQQLQQPFHQQVPLQVNGNGYVDTMLHSRNPSYPSQTSTGTPLSQIPERAIHAQPFQPTPYHQHQPQAYYPQQQQQQQQPQPQQHQQHQHQYQGMHPPQGYYYPQNYSSIASQGGAPPFIPASQQQQQFSQPAAQTDSAGVTNLVAQEVNGMVYYYDAAQIPAVASFPAYQHAPPSYPLQHGGNMGMGGMMTPSPDGFYYPQANQGVIFYSQ